MVAGATRSSQNVILGIFCLITVFFAVVRVRDTFIDRQIVKASELNRQFMEHLEQINIEQEERAAFVQISHEGNPGMKVEIIVLWSPVRMLGGSQEQIDQVKHGKVFKSFYGLKCIVIK